VTPGMIGQAIGLFAVTNIDDLVVLALFFARGAGHRSTTARIATGQYLGFAAILAAAIAAALGATLLPEAAVPYLGVLPLLLGLRAAVNLWRTSDDDNAQNAPAPPGVLEVAAVTFANGGDNIGVYVPVLATAGAGAISGYAVVFLVLVGAWVAAGRFFATRPVIARALSRWGHLLLPLVLIGIGALILVEGNAFGL
jgi:cadmium resistance protein CadD (predicted permease)